MLTIGEFPTSNGQEFQTTVAAEANERRPYEVRFHLGVWRRHLFDERRVVGGERGDNKFKLFSHSVLLRDCDVCDRRMSLLVSFILKVINVHDLTNRNERNTAIGVWDSIILSNAIIIT